MILDYKKQINLINVMEVNTPIHVIGCGALGSWIVFFLNKMGFDNVTYYDFDVVEEHNLPNQLFREADIRRSKVYAIDDILKAFNYGDSRDYNPMNTRLGRKDVKEMEGIIFSAVDSMRTRELIYKGFRENDKLEMFLDGRLSIYGYYTYAVTKDSEFKYEDTLYSDEEAEVSACGVSQTALPSAVMCASTMIMNMIEYLNGNPPEESIMISVPWMDKV